MRAGVDHPWTALYVGMLADVCAPLLLCPELDLLVAVDRIDPDYLRPWYEPCGVPKDFAHIRVFVRRILEEGSDIDLQCRACLLRKTSTDWPNEIRSIRQKCSIVLDELDEKRKCWTLDFSYRSKVRRLRYYYNRDYVADDWPMEARHLSALLTVGTPFPAVASLRTLRPRLMSRCRSDCLVYASTITLEDEPEGWFWPAEKAKIAMRRASDRIHVHSFLLTDWLAAHEHSCATCGKAGDKICSRCRDRHYCSVVYKIDSFSFFCSHSQSKLTLLLLGQECQKSDYPSHKQQCIAHKA